MDNLDKDLIQQLVKEAVEKETLALREELENVKTEQKNSSVVIENLIKENKKLWEEIEKVDRNLDEVEQYNRKPSLILGGSFPEGKEGETPAETRETVHKVIKDKLKVTLKGDIIACHRLRNKRRVIVKFQDSEDREAVYQAKFEQEGQPGERVTVHENLTEKRSKMINILEEMRKRREVLNYHTRNGMIMARDAAHKRYTRIQPWFTEQEIKVTLEKAALRTTGHNNNFMRSQTLTNIPKGTVARKTTNLEEYVVPSTSTRQTRQTKKADNTE